jgi:hypothetical protein
VLPKQQQAAVLQLLLTSLRSFPEDATQLATQQFADMLVQLFAKQQQREQPISVSYSTGAGSASVEAAKLVPAVLQVVDGGSGSVYSMLLSQLDLASAPDGGKEEVQQQQTHRLAVLQLLQLALNDSQAAAGVIAAAHALTQQPSSAGTAVSAAVELLWLQHRMQLPLSPVLDLLLDLTGPAAARSVLEAAAAYNNCSAARLLLHLAAASQMTGEEVDALQLPSSCSDNPARLLLLVRLLPHVHDRNLVAAAVQCCFFSFSSSSSSSSMQLPGAAIQLTGQPAEGTCMLATCSLTMKEQRALLQLLHELDVASAQSADQQQRGWLRLYLNNLFAQLARHIEPSTAECKDESAAGAAAAAPAGAQLQLTQLADILSVPGSWQVQPQSQPSPKEPAGLAAALRAELASAYLPSLAALLAADSVTASAAAACLMRLLPGFSDEDVQQVLAQAQLSSSKQAAAGSNAVAFFSTEQQAVQRSKQRTCAEDFTRVRTKLETHIQKAKAADAAAGSSGSGRQLRLPDFDYPTAAAALADGSSSARVESRLVLTETTQENIRRVLDVVDNPAPLLLEGPTGVGKSAIISEAARLLGKQLIRFNMSSSITPEDLLGRVLMKAAPAGSSSNSSSGTGGGYVFEHQLQPFAAAFEAGHWLLLDELNLARDDVLQCIEHALDPNNKVSVRAGSLGILECCQCL